MSDALLELRGLTVDFAVGRDSYHAVRGVDLDVHPGEVVGIVGESGSGKSVTMLAVLGLLGPNARVGGSARFAGTELIGGRDATLRSMRGGRIGMIFQDPMTSLNPALTVGFQLAEAVEVHQTDPAGKAGGGPGCRNCSRWCPSPTRSSGCGRTRTSCRAACASG